MTAAIRRLRPKAHDRAASALQLVLELPLRLRPELRAELTDALSSYAPQPWPFVMLSTAQSRRIIRQVATGDRPGVTATVWLAALGCADYGTAEIAASRRDLAELAGTSVQEVSRALSRLVQLGALVRTGRGHYALHPSVAWSGSLADRERAEREVQPVTPE